MHHQQSVIVGVCCSAAVALLLGCSFGDTDSEEGNAVQSRMRRSSSPLVVRQKVRVGTDNIVAVRTFPSAACKLHSQNPTDSAQPVDLVADADGLVYYHVYPESVGDTTEVSIDCQDESGSSASYSAKTEATVDAPLLARPVPKGKVRPALTGDPLAVSQSELVAGGYPPRPDPARSPDAYQRWINDVSRPMIVGTGKRVKSNRRFADIHSSNWAGYNTRQNSQYRGPFEFVQAQWTIPTISGYLGNGENLVAFWVGLGYGAPTSDLWQGGVSVTDTAGAKVYRLWDELVNGTCGCCGDNEYAGWCPDPNPGDVIFVEEWLGDWNQSFNVTPNRGDLQYLWTYIANYTTGCVIGPVGWNYNVDWIQYYGYNPANCPDHLIGDTTEWIAERYTTEPVTKFGSVTMTNAEFYDRSTWTFPGVGQASLYHDILDNSCLDSRGRPTITHPINSSVGTSSVGFTWASYGNPNPNTRCQ